MTEYDAYTKYTSLIHRYENSLCCDSRSERGLLVVLVLPGTFLSGFLCVVAVCLSFTSLIMHRNLCMCILPIGFSGKLNSNDLIWRSEKLHLTYPLCYLLSQEQPPITTDSASANSTADAIKASLTYKLLDNNNSSVYQHILFEKYLLLFTSGACCF